MKKIIILLSALAIILYISSCSKPNKCNAGTGGSVSFDLIPQHHGKPVPNRAAYLDSAFIKFNATDFPGASPSSYDLVVQGNVGDLDIKVGGMQCGQYYIYMTGFDTVFHARVVGGTPVNFTDQSGEKQFIIPITETI